MTNGIAVAVTAFLMAINLSIIVKLIAVDIKRNNDRLTVLLLYASLALLGWQAAYAMMFITSDFGVIRFLVDFKLPFIAFASFFMAMTVIRFYRLEQYVNRTMVMIMLIIPVFTFIYSLLSPYNDLIRQSFTVLATEPIVEVIAVRGVWFWIHTVSCYIFVFGALAAGINCHRKLPRAYRTPSFVLLIGPSLVIVINLLQIMNMGYRYYDISIIGTSLAVTTIYFSVIRSKGVDFIISVRNVIYDRLNEGIFVLNDERYIVYLNQNAGRLVRGLGLNVLNQLYDIVFEKAVEFTSHIEAAPADEDGLDMTFMESGAETIYNLREKPIKDRAGMPIGTFAVLTNVTENRAIINKLENIGGIDALTGLPNRRSIEKFLMSVNNSSKLPIAIISADINGLKEVNDDLGHKQGDVLIRLMADVLSDVCPAKGRVSRIGGDEFLIIVPNSDEEEIADMTAEIDKRLAESRNYMFKPSISMGFDMKIREDQDIIEVAQSADEKMYENKYQMKSLRKE